VSLIASSCVRTFNPTRQLYADKPCILSKIEMLLKKKKVKDYNAVVEGINSLRSVSQYLCLWSGCQLWDPENHFQQKQKITIWTGL